MKFIPGIVCVVIGATGLFLPNITGWQNVFPAIALIGGLSMIATTKVPQ